MLKKILIRVFNYLQSIRQRILYPSLRFARFIRVRNSEVLISRNCSIRGSLVLDDSTFEIGKGSIVHKSASISFCGAGAAFRSGAGVEIGAYADIGGYGVIRIGDFTTTAPFFTCIGDVSIGCNTLIAPRVFISSGTHVAKSKELIRVQDANFLRQNGRISSRPIVIGNDCWLGVNVVICPGVNLGTGCVVGAGSVVTKSFPEYSIVAGVPAKVIGYRQ